MFASDIIHFKVNVFSVLATYRAHEIRNTQKKLFLRIVKKSREILLKLEDS